MRTRLDNRSKGRREGYNARKVPVVYGIHPAYRNWVRGRAVPALAKVQS